MFVYTSSSGSSSSSNNVGLKLAVDSRSVPDRKGYVSGDDRKEYKRSHDATMSEREFLAVNSKQSLALGVYRTECAPYPLVIYYALVDGLEDVGKGGNNTAFFGEALEGLDDLDLDI